MCRQPPGHSSIRKTYRAHVVRLQRSPGKAVGRPTSFLALEETMNTANRSSIRYLSACMVIATALVSESPATAAAPDFTVVFAAGTACNFILQIDGSSGNSHIKEFTDKNGNVVRSIQAGTGSALSFTNIATGNTVSTRSNGAISHITFNPDGSQTQMLTGHNVLILFPTDNPPGPSTTLIVGRVVFTVAPPPTGVFNVQEISGNTTDICGALS